MIGENIRRLRVEKGMTQKELADKLFVTAQAVSRWENGEVEPSVSTISAIAKIFEVSGDEILGIEGFSPKPEVKVEKEYVVKESKPVLALCEDCNQPIYDSNDIVRITGARSGSHVRCKKCEKARQDKNKKLKVKKSRSRRILSFWLGGLAFAIMLAIGIVLFTKDKVGWGIFCIGVGVGLFAFISCCLFENNFIGEMTVGIFEWGFVKMPGVIFSLDLDGIIWFLTVKLLFWILEIALACCAGVLAIALGTVLSIFVYPFALHKNIKHPEEIELV